MWSYKGMRVIQGVWQVRWDGEEGQTGMGRRVSVVTYVSRNACVKSNENICQFLRTVLSAITLPRMPTE